MRLSCSTLTALVSHSACYETLVQLAFCVIVGRLAFACIYKNRAAFLQLLLQIFVFDCVTMSMVKNKRSIEATKVR